MGRILPAGVCRDAPEIIVGLLVAARKKNGDCVCELSSCLVSFLFSSSSFCVVPPTDHPFVVDGSVVVGRLAVGKCGPSKSSSCGCYCSWIGADCICCCSRSLQLLLWSCDLVWQ